MNQPFDHHLSPEQRELIDSLVSPRKIQDFLDTTAYSPEYENRCPLRVMVDRQAHCLDGGLFAASALRRIGYPPLVVDVFPDPGMDDDHVLAIFQQNDRWGAVAKSNFVGLRYREPVYTSLRELVMSYFDQFYNVNGIKTLRTHTRPVDLTQFDNLGWEWLRQRRGHRLKRLSSNADAINYYRLPWLKTFHRSMSSRYKAGLMIANWDGLYKPAK